MNLSQREYILIGVLSAVLIFWKRKEIVVKAIEVKNMALSRGIRNNNPGNIRKSSDQWQGLAADQSSDKSFFVFESPEYGIRALTKLVKNYYNNKGLTTIKGIISRWAPPSENNTSAYVNAVSKAVGKAPTDTLDLDTDLVPLVTAIIKHENGSQPYDMATIEEGVSLA